MHKFMYHVQGLDQEGKVIRSRLYTREYAAMEYAENLLNYCHGITPYIQAHELLPLHSYSHWAMPKGIYPNRRDAEISIFGYSDIPTEER